MKQGKKVHTEQERYIWTRFNGSRKKNQGGALQQVFKDARARRLNFFGTFETVPNHRTSSGPTVPLGEAVACMLRKFAQDEGVTMTNSPYTEANKKCN